MTSLVAKLAIPAPLQAAWAVIKPAAPYVAAGLALLLGWHAVAVHYREQGRAESAAVIAGDQIAMRRGIDSINALRGALRDQNAAIDRLAAEGDARARQAVQERDAALRANRMLSDQARALAASAAHPSGKPCAISDTLKNAKDL